MSVLRTLQEWYASHADGDWEHQHGIVIETLDNPGWSITIDLESTPLEGRPFRDVRNERSATDWIHAVISDDKWRCACGPRNLEEGLRVFLDWGGIAE